MGRVSAIPPSLYGGWGGSVPYKVGVTFLVGGALVLGLVGILWGGNFGENFVDENFVDYGANFSGKQSRGFQFSHFSASPRPRRGEVHARMKKRRG